VAGRVMLINAAEIEQALRAAQERADQTGEPQPVGFVARFTDGSWVATDGVVQPTVAPA